MKKIMGKKQNLCCIVVTYNRKEQLVKCLNALKNQTFIFDAVYVIDNNSNDGTNKHLIDCFFYDADKSLSDKRHFSSRIYYEGGTSSFDFFYFNTESNLGGAGGFNEGLRHALRSDYDWFWLMDDDTIPTDRALFHLFNAATILNSENAEMVGFCCSHVNWNDGKPHKMNIPNISSFINDNPFNLFSTSSHKALLVNSCSFVSVLINKKAIIQCGLPIKDFFIWNDDVEYTQRISKAGFYGLYVPDSIVFHNTEKNYSATIENIDQKNIWKVFYGTRNTVYMIRKNNKTIKIFFLLLKYILCNLRLITKNSNFLLCLCNFLKGFLSGLFFNPKIDYFDKNNP